MDIRTVVFSRAAYKPEDFPRDGRPQFAFVGRSNVGKSSLINTILRRKGIARVSQTPGKTQAVQFYLVNDRFYLVDLPGYGYAKVSRSVTNTWGALIRSYLESSDALRRIFLLVDSRHEPSPLDVSMREWTQAYGKRWRVVMTKSDKLSKTQLMKSRRDIGRTMEEDPASLIAFSTETRSGVDEIWRDVDHSLQGKDEQ